MINSNDIVQVFEYNQHFVAMMNIINHSKLNPPTSGHKHHIIPRCWFKMNGKEVDNSTDNLVLLTYEDHIKVHKLAYLCAKDIKFKSKMVYAYHRLSEGECLNKDLVKGEYSSNYGKKFTVEHRNKISKSLKDKSKSKEHRNNLSNAMKGHIPWNKDKKGTVSMDEVICSYKQYKLTSKFPLNWNCYQSLYHKGEL